MQSQAVSQLLWLWSWSGALLSFGGAKLTATASRGTAGRDNAETNELQGRSATLEMVQTPMWERPRRAATAAVQNDSSSGGGSRNATESGPGANLEVMLPMLPTALL